MRRIERGANRIDVSQRAGGFFDFAEARRPQGLAHPVLLQPLAVALDVELDEVVVHLALIAHAVAAQQLLEARGVVDVDAQGARAARVGAGGDEGGGVV